MNAPELRDIHLPEAALWWPPGIAWWLLLALVALLGLALWWWYRRRRFPPLRRLSLRELESIRRARVDGLDDRSTINAVARLLRRTLIGYQGRASQAASTGTAWIAEIDRLSSSRGFSDAQLRLLARERYRAHCDCDIDALLESCESWIRHLPRRDARVPA